MDDNIVFKPNNWDDHDGNYVDFISCRYVAIDYSIKRLLNLLRHAHSMESFPSYNRIVNNTPKNTYCTDIEISFGLTNNIMEQNDNLICKLHLFQVGMLKCINANYDTVNQFFWPPIYHCK